MHYNAMDETFSRHLYQVDGLINLIQKYKNLASIVFSTSTLMKLSSHHA